MSFALGFLFLLSIFGGAGEFGRQSLRLLNTLFGLAGFIVPFVLCAIGYVLWRGRELKLRGFSVIGMILLFVFVPAVFGVFQAGGSIGDGVAKIATNTFGTAAGFLILCALAIASGLLATNLSLKQIRSLLTGRTDEEGQPEMQPEPRVSVFQTVKNRLNNRAYTAEAPVMSNPSQATIVAPKKVYDKNWTFPPLDLLPENSSKAVPGNIPKNIEIIQKTFKDFGIEVGMGEVFVGPTVTQYTLKPAEGVKLTALTARQDDVALALAAHPIRIEAPIPGKSFVGIEVPNKTQAVVTLREVLSTKDFKALGSPLTLALGRDVAGAPFVADLQKMPHLLIAGSTGSGKSVAMNSIIMSLLFQNSPADMRMILIDPKRVEFTLYNGIPHLLTSVVTETDKTINTLRWVVAEMERRYKLFAETHKRNIAEYNADPSAEHMPFLVVIIDELADLMMQAANEVEAAIVRLSQLARATGIHLIVATQRPSVDVITGLIKANIATRIAFAVASQIDSRTIIDQAGADKLLGRGDMLYLGNEIGKPKRVQGVLVGEKEIKALTDFLKREGSAQYDESIQDYRPAGSGNGGGRGGEGPVDDDLFEDAKQVVLQSGKASASLLQRRLRVGYARAARLLDILEQEGIIGPAEGSKPRDVIADASSIQTSAPVYSQQPVNPRNPYPSTPSYNDKPTVNEYNRDNE